MSPARTDLWVATANIGRKKSAARRSHAIGVVRAAFPNPIIAWQEIDGADSGDEHAMLTDRMPRYEWAHFESQEPIGYPPHWKPIAERRTKAHGGKAKVSPARYVSELLLEHRETGQRVWIINSHFVAGAWVNPGQHAEAWRRSSWLRHFELLKDRVALRVDQGEPVVVLGDFNHPDMPQIHPAEREAIRDKPDYIRVIGRGVKILDTLKVPLGIDTHAALGAHLSIE